MFFEDNIDTYRLLPFHHQLKIEQQIFLNTQHIDYFKYKAERLQHLKTINKNDILNPLIEYVESFIPRIAVFPGSFNPFHKGHYDVLLKAEKLFDKVIIAFGDNPDKPQRSFPIPKTIQNRQIEHYNGLLTDFLNTLPYEATVVRGLRNSTDFHYEQNQYRYLQELKADIKIINIFCDKNFEHISSSGIRTLQKFNKHQIYLLD